MENKNQKLQNEFEEKEEIEYTNDDERKYSYWFTLQLKSPNKVINCNVQKEDSLYYSFINRKEAPYVFFKENEREEQIKFCTRLVTRNSYPYVNDGYSIAIWEITLDGAK